ncbi:MAG: 30S ribosomal protein S4 [Candidatus Harrisonbacteria bacterium CG10_big_fil_rev_8_21_14_0_10_44_23]|uniref:Small ribosomal subunit protein uS4 n=1 Tax=Candidatus Harrisonbacteria bacterium CG10_big_fil_rev_8_21_14_0_10_44_23 TaxID=1974585 RepID=A0A2H0UQ50_9BACT|nr:MAG: 30S ribosomal protein S4 [Candidatus Harrisonbacteria bacterium CG10_big_fil_rev_8_21_14_0_10_44_23]
MGFNTKEKQERALGEKLNLKPIRSFSEKSASTRRPYRPGVHGQARRRLTEYGKQLAEKQKFRVSYGLRESQMRNYFLKAKNSHEATGQAFMSLLERRLDNVVYRLGLAGSRSVARQLVGHGHIVVNGRKSATPSRQVKKGDVIAIREQSQNSPMFAELEKTLSQHETPYWLKMDPKKREGIVSSAPKDLDIPFDISLVVDYYSKTVK